MGNENEATKISTENYKAIEIAKKKKLLVALRVVHTLLNSIQFVLLAKVQSDDTAKHVTRSVSVFVGGGPKSEQ